MNLHNPLPAFWSNFLYSSDALKVANKVFSSQWQPKKTECSKTIEAYQKHLLNHTHFQKNQDLQATFKQNQTLKEVQDEHSDLFVLALWAIFERFLRDFLLEKGQALQQHVTPNILAQGLYQHYQKEVEYWKPDEMLDFMKNLMIQQNNNIDLIGNAKQIYTYRNWVAHGKKVGKKPSHVKPQTAYETLTQIADILLQNT